MEGEVLGKRKGIRRRGAVGKRGKRGYWGNKYDQRMCVHYKNVTVKSIVLYNRYALIKNPCLALSPNPGLLCHAISPTPIKSPH
jgi:hypothetical protein